MLTDFLLAMMLPFAFIIAAIAISPLFLLVATIGKSWEEIREILAVVLPM